MMEKHINIYELWVLECSLVYCIVWRFVFLSKFGNPTSSCRLSSWQPLLDPSAWQLVVKTRLLPDQSSILTYLPNQKKTTESGSFQTIVPTLAAAVGLLGSGSLSGDSVSNLSHSSDEETQQTQPVPSRRVLDEVLSKGDRVTQKEKQRQVNTLIASMSCPRCMSLASRSSWSDDGSSLSLVHQVLEENHFERARHYIQSRKNHRSASTICLILFHVLWPKSQGFAEETSACDTIADPFALWKGGRHHLHTAAYSRLCWGKKWSTWPSCRRCCSTCMNSGRRKDFALKPAVASFLGKPAWDSWNKSVDSFAVAAKSE